MISHYYIDDDFCKDKGINDELNELIINNFCEPIDDNIKWSTYKTTLG